MITSASPTDWRDLQRQVARILCEVGMEVAVEKKQAMARGETKKIDVYAEERVDGLSRSIAIECKRWRRTIDQERVHGFRTVVIDAGVDVGYVVSSGGFQDGARRAAESTNIRLRTWEDFQAEFEQAWLKRYLLPLVERQMERLFIYTDSLVDVREIGEAGVEHYNALYFRHRPFATLMKEF